MDGEVAANIFIAGKGYPMKVPPEGEEILRQAEAFVKNKLAEYCIKYPDQDKRDILAVALVNVAAQLFEYKKLNDSRQSDIEKIDRKLGVYLEKQGSLDNIE
jgi:cell division protein ZapA (FtsZ GTPase activity inhibitor)